MLLVLSNIGLIAAEESWADGQKQTKRQTADRPAYKAERGYMRERRKARKGKWNGGGGRGRATRVSALRPLKKKLWQGYEWSMANL